MEDTKAITFDKSDFHYKTETFGLLRDHYCKGLVEIPSTHLSRIEINTGLQ